MSFLILNKKLGSLLGAVIGDALGWPYEDRSMCKTKLERSSNFQTWTRRSGGRFYTHEEIINKGDYSDDTQLLFSTARSLKFGSKWAKHFAKVELPAWLLYERGGGGATKRAAQSLSKGTPPWKSPGTESFRYFEAGGNGVAMRILPHLFVSDDKETIFSQVFINGINTHGHPRALLGAILYANALYYLFKKVGTLEYGELIDYLLDSKEEWSKMPITQKMDDWLGFANYATKGNYTILWEKTVEELVDGLKIARQGMDLGILDNGNEILSKLGCFDSKTRGAGTVAVLVSTYIASKYASDPYSGLLEVATLKNADTDTLASMVGGLMGALSGIDWIKDEWINEVQDYKYINEIVEKIGTFTEEEKEIKLWSHNDNTKVKGLLKEMVPNETILFGPFKQIRLLEHHHNKVLVNNYDIVSSKFISEEGQTIYIKTFNKKIKLDNQNSTLTPEGNVNTDYKVGAFKLNSKDLIELSEVFQGNLRAKRAFQLLADIINGLEDANKRNFQFNEEFIEKFCTDFVQKGIDFMQVHKIVMFILSRK